MIDSNLGWTINFWINRTNSASYPVILYLRNGTALNESYFAVKLYYTSVCWRYYYILSNSVKADVNNKGCTDITASNWTMITYTYDDDLNMTYRYVNGVLKDGYSIDLTNDTFSWNRLQVGDNPQNFFTLDEVSFWSVNLNQYQINTLYNDGIGLTFDELVNISNSTASYNNSKRCLSENVLCDIGYFNSSEFYFCNHNVTCSSGCIQNDFSSDGYCNVDTIKLDNNYFSSKQCFYNTLTKESYICNNTIFLYNNTLSIFLNRNSYLNGVYCNIDDVLICNDNKPCIQYVEDLNTSKQYYLSESKTCTELTEIYIPYGYKVMCDYIFSLTDYIHSACYNAVSITIPTTSCSDLQIWDILNTSDTFYTSGKCFNSTPLISTNLCDGFSENQTRCNGNVIETCHNDSNALFWNFTEDCTLRGWKYTCHLGKCLYSDNKCRTDYDCTNGYFCSSGYCVLNSGTGCTTSANCPNGQTCVNNVCGGSQTNIFDNISIEVRYLIMIGLVIIFMLLPMILAGKEGVLAGLVLSSIICIALTIIFHLNILISIVYVILAGGVFAVIIRMSASG